MYRLIMSSVGVRPGDRLAIGPTALMEPNRRNFEVVYKLTRDSVYRFCRRLCNSREDAEDLVQETYVKALGALDRYQANRPVENWLLRIAQNAYLDSRRKALRRPKTISGSALNEGMESKTLVDPAPGPDSIVQDLMVNERILNAIQHLDKGTREIIREVHIEHRPYASIAKERKLKLTTLRSRLFRARRSIQRQIHLCETGQCKC